MTSNPMGAVGGKLGFLELVAPQSANNESRRLGRCFGSTCLFQQELHSVLATASTERPILMRVERGGVRGEVLDIWNTVHTSPFLFILTVVIC